MTWERVSIPKYPVQLVEWSLLAGGNNIYWVGGNFPGSSIFQSESSGKLAAFLVFLFWAVLWYTLALAKYQNSWWLLFVDRNKMPPSRLSFCLHFWDCRINVVVFSLIPEFENRFAFCSTMFFIWVALIYFVGVLFVSDERNCHI